MLAERIQTCMQREGIRSWRRLAELAQLSPSYLGDIKTGRTQPSLATLQSIANALRTTVGYLLEETENAAPEERAPIGEPKGDLEASQDLDKLIRELAQYNPDLILLFRDTRKNWKGITPRTKEKIAAGMKFALELAELEESEGFYTPKSDKDL